VRELACSPLSDEVGTVECRVCGERFVCITRTHLKKHGLTFEDYKRLYPDAPLMSVELYQKHAERLRSQASEASKKSWMNREAKVKAIREGRAKRVEVKKCVDCGREFQSTEPWLQVRCPECQKLRLRFLDNQRYYRLKRYMLNDFKVLNEFETHLSETHYPCLFGAGTDGTPPMNLNVLPNGRVAGAVWLESGGKQFHTSPITPWRRRLPKSGWQKRIMETCPECGERNVLVYVENPHCLECGAEIIFADENEYYTVSEFACSKCGLVDNGIHFIFKCSKCGSEYRVAVGEDVEQIKVV
jgi:predicted Zn-ribbon and HTH transcriptional regulator/ribosomal protein S27AE